MQRHSFNMNCTLQGTCVKAFGKAIQALSKIGDELWIDPMVKGLALRSVNAAQSAYACFFFSTIFFQKYSLVSVEASEPIKCKLYMKSLLPLFRCLTSIERNVERCQISVNASNDRIMIQFSCRHGITKTHNLCYQESEALQAVFASHLCPNVLKAPARLLANMVMHFPASQEEVTLSIAPLRVSLMNYHQEANDHGKMICTEVSLHPDEFDFFQSAGDSAITFCLKELRGLLHFAESLCLPVSIHFGTAGKPVCFSVEDLVMEATVVLATLIDSDSRSSSQPTKSPDPTSPRCEDAAVVGARDGGLSHAAVVGARDGDLSHAAVVGARDGGLSHAAVVDARDGGLSHDAGVHVVASSQGSPLGPSATLTQLLSHHHSLLRPGAPNHTSPASSTICSLLFRALSATQSESPAATPPVLACHSDPEEEEDPARPSVSG
ncbi:cell cycle checkpoint control protein RAD9B [Nerophis ophidion]|uniref:cell cycle checkpoint control protein RAD9B n=1 Tax=Nerophis ophidion TaxID=159077 RepID=UPI002AE00C3E|nr:cell cycle checkpoint control protein RAD9B [Nerophis ophidion]